MESKSKVNVTVERDGEVNVFTRDAALIVAFDVIGKKMDMTVAFKGDASNENLANAVAHAIDDVDNKCEGFIDEVMNSLLRIQIKRITGLLNKED